MRAKQTKEAWEQYRSEELQRVTSLLSQLGFALDHEQIHIGGERHLMSGRKLVLTGRRLADNKRVIIKVSSDTQGIAEIQQEHETRKIIHTLPFAFRAFFSPEEVLFVKQKEYLIDITAFIEQEKNFIALPLEEQFFLALQAFETQEGVHATTHSHANIIKDVFGSVDAKWYIDSFETFRTQSQKADPENRELAAVFSQASEFLAMHKLVIDRYCGFLTHHDFAPHNLRVSGHTIYLLDFSSIHFGNKYESWARFLNFMMQYNPPLEEQLMHYVRQNRGEEEYLCLRLMRTYKIGFLLAFYTEALEKTEGDLRIIMDMRITLWIQALEHILRDTPMPTGIIDEYMHKLETLRSKEEKERQREISAL